LIGFVENETTAKSRLVAIGAKVELGYDIDASIEMGIDGDVGAGVDGSSGWKMRKMDPLLRGKPRHPLKGSWSGAARKG